MEYENLLIEIVQSGRTFDAIKDLIEVAKNSQEYMEYRYSDFKGRLVAINKIATGPNTARGKLEGIIPLSEVEGDKNGKKDS